MWDILSLGILIACHEEQVGPVLQLRHVGLKLAAYTSQTLVALLTAPDKPERPPVSPASHTSRAGFADMGVRSRTEMSPCVAGRASDSVAALQPVPQQPPAQQVAQGSAPGAALANASRMENIDDWSDLRLPLPGVTNPLQQSPFTDRAFIQKFIAYKERSGVTSNRVKLMVCNNWRCQRSRLRFVMLNSRHRAHSVP